MRGHYEVDYERKTGAGIAIYGAVTGGRYRKAGKKKKGEILEEFCQSTGYHRKYAIALLRNAGKTQLRRMGNGTVKVKITAKTRKKRVYKRFYDETVAQAVIAIWDFFRCVCGKRLVPMIRSNLPALAGKFGIPLEVQAKYLIGR